MTKKLAGALLLIMLLCLTATTLAADKVLIVATPDEAAQAELWITTDTQLVLLTDCTDAQKKQIRGMVQAKGAPDAVYCGYARLSPITIESLNYRWQGKGKPYSSLLTVLRQSGCERVEWYASPEQPALAEFLPGLLLEACSDADNVCIEGNDKRPQFGQRITVLANAADGTEQIVPEGSWRDELRAEWGEDPKPEDVPGLPQLNAQGLLDSGEFLLEDVENGIWCYASPELRVIITRHERVGKPALVWYEADILRSADTAEHLHCVSGTGNGRATYPEDMAQGWVLAVNSDYHQYRVKKQPGLIVRDGQVIYGDRLGKADSRGMPNMDCMLLTRDGGLSLYPATTLNAAGALSLNACDVVSFGPIFIQDGRWKQILCEYRDHLEPRAAIGSLGENHYLAVFVEGRMAESKGCSLNALQQLMYIRGCRDAMNMDGGRTACMFFMGKQIGYVGNDAGVKGTPRSQWEMITIGDLRDR